MFELTWTRHKVGYQWVKGRALSEVEISETSKVGTVERAFPKHQLDISALSFVRKHVGRSKQWLVAKATSTAQYNPLESIEGEPLFRLFATTEPSEEGIVQFAEQYGLLGVGLPIEKKDGGIAYGEPLHLWQYEIKKMMEATEVYFHAKEHDEDWLSEHVQQSSLDTDNLVLLGHHFTFQLIEEALVLYSVTPLPVWSPYLPLEKPQVELKFQPKNLLAAMWLQFAQAVAGDVQYKHCKHCEKWLEISTGRQGKRSDAVFCSDKCRVKQHQGNIRSARRLHAEGMR